MENIIYFNQNILKLVRGEQTKDGYIVDLYQEIILPSQNIYSDEYAREVVKHLKNITLLNATLVLDSHGALWKVGKIPVVKSLRMARELVIKELQEMVDPHVEYVYDFRLFKKQEKTGMRVLMFAMDKKIVERFIDIFNQAQVNIDRIDISLNCLVSVYEHCFRHDYPLIGIIDIQKQQINTLLYVDGKFSYYGQDTLPEYEDSEQLRTTLVNKVSQLIQFQRSHFRDQTLKDVVISGIRQENLDDLKNTLKYLFHIQLLNFNDDQFVKYKRINTETVQGIVNIGALKERK